jgi:N-methylhydantoinase B
MERMTSAPFGLLGGKAGAAAVVTLTTPDGTTRHLPSKGAFNAPAGSVVDMITPGSGGFGAPGKRDSAAIGRDLLDGYVSASAARDGYAIANPEALRAAAAAEDHATES